LRVSVKAWRDFLRQRREPLVAFLAEKDRLPPQEVASRLDNLLTALDFVDRIEVRRKSEPGQVILSLTVTPSRPLRR